MSLKALFLTAIVLLTLPLASLADHTRVLYKTEFEAPLFTPGLLTGQSDFIAYQADSIPGASIVRDNFGRRKQHVLIDGSQLSWFDGDFEGYYYPYKEYFPLAERTPIITISWTMQFQPQQPYFGLAGISAYDPSGELYTGMEIGADGLLHYGGAEIRTVPIALNQWHRMLMRLDFTTRTAEFFLNGRSLGKGAFASTIATCFSDADLHIKGGIFRASHKALFDSYKVTASDKNSHSGEDDD